MMYRLIFLTGSLRNQRITVEQEPMTIGHDPGCAISVSDEEMAAQHAVLEHRKEGLFIRDLGSMNRILVNKREVREARLKHGDAVEIGRTRFLVQAVVQAEVARGGPTTSRRRQWRELGGLVILVLAATVAANLFVWRNTRPGSSEKLFTDLPSEDPVSAELPVDVLLPMIQPGEESEDLRLVRADLAAIRETVKALTDRVQTAGTEHPEHERMREVVGEKAAEMFEEAIDAVREGNAIRADQLLAGISILEPDSISVYEERARLFERRGMSEQAIQQWGEIISRNPSTEVFERAVGERLRLSRDLSAGESGCVRIVSADQHKVLATGDYDEMRLLKVVLKQRSDDLLLDPHAVRIEVAFYDEDRDAGSIRPTRAVVPQTVLQPEWPWDAAETKTVTATYLVPKGRRSRTQFYGYVVRVFYNERIQDMRARPRNLLHATERSRHTAAEGAK